MHYMHPHSHACTHSRSLALALRTHSLTHFYAHALTITHTEALPCSATPHTYNHITVHPCSATRNPPLDSCAHALHPHTHHLPGFCIPLPSGRMSSRVMQHWHAASTRQEGAAGQMFSMPHASWSCSMLQLAWRCSMSWPRAETVCRVSRGDSYAC